GPRQDLDLRVRRDPLAKVRPRAEPIASVREGDALAPFGQNERLLERRIAAAYDEHPPPSEPFCVPRGRGADAAPDELGLAGDAEASTPHPGRQHRARRRDPRARDLARARGDVDSRDLDARADLGAEPLDVAREPLGEG